MVDQWIDRAGYRTHVVMPGQGFSNRYVRRRTWVGCTVQQRPEVVNPIDSHVVMWIADGKAFRACGPMEYVDTHRYGVHMSGTGVR
jgi:hypothetical protein